MVSWISINTDWAMVKLTIHVPVRSHKPIGLVNRGQPNPDLLVQSKVHDFQYRVFAPYLPLYFCSPGRSQYLK
jgi:hypothetical protein